VRLSAQNGGKRGRAGYAPGRQQQNFPAPGEHLFRQVVEDVVVVRVLLCGVEYDVAALARKLPPQVSALGE
jgi:hypothetical protein